jgi:exosortase A
MITVSTEGRNTAAGTGHHGEWLRYGLYALLVFAGIGALFYQTASSMVAIWVRSETFTHGFLILPIALWLVWDRREYVVRTQPRPQLRVLLLSVPLGLGWLLGYLVDVLVVQQFALVGLLIVALWSLLGHSAARSVAFPLGFLLFMVPVGEGLIPPMMDFTADFTVYMLKLTGIPVYREGTFFSIPSGNWSVVEGCSGVRYLIASVTLGVLYAYLTYTRLHKRLIFTALSIIVPVFANGFRAYLIVMIAHLSDMKLALGVDHFIYGWVWFGIVITILFALGALFRDPPEELPPAEPSGGVATSSPAGLRALAAVLLATAVWPAVAFVLDSQTPPTELAAPLQAPAGTAGWQVSAEDAWSWRPETLNPDAQIYSYYRRDGRVVGVSLALYVSQRQDAELVNSQNIMIRQKHPEWSNKGRGSETVRLGERDTVVDRAKLVSSTRRLLVWHWYRVGGFHTANPYLAKVLEAVSRLSGTRRDGVLIAVATPYRDKMDEAEPVLRAFVGDMLPSLNAALDKATGVE